MRLGRFRGGAAAAEPRRRLGAPRRCTPLRISSLLAACALLAFASHAETQSLRCGSRLISPGDPAAKMRRYCGEPEAIHSRLEQRGVFARGRYLPGFLQEVLVEDWTYNFGPNKLMRQVRVVDGIVEEIDLLGYGYRDASL